MFFAPRRIAAKSPSITVIARREAPRQSTGATLDCFAPLAMTGESSADRGRADHHSDRAVGAPGGGLSQLIVTPALSRGPPFFSAPPRFRVKMSCSRRAAEKDELDALVGLDNCAHHPSLASDSILQSPSGERFSVWVPWLIHSLCSNVQPVTSHRSAAG